MEKDLILRLEKLERKHQKLKLALISCAALLLLVTLGFSFKGKEHFNIIRAKGIVIEDSLGKDRILIGAPVPYSKYRVRTDTNLVRRHMAGRIYKKDPEQYMKWYRRYRHSAIGMIVMNEGGFDKVLIGDKLADANVGRRIFDNSGILWNDDMGMELGGAGVNTSADGKANVVVGLDDAEGEAVHLFAHADQTKGLVIQGKDGELVIGMAKAEGARFRNKQKFTGIKYFNKEGKLMWEQEIKTDGQK